MNVDRPVSRRRGETLSPWMRVPNAPHAWMRIVEGGDPCKIADRRVFVEKTPRVYDPACGVPADTRFYPCGRGWDREIWKTLDGLRLPGPVWIEGYKGYADEGDGPDLDSRHWADVKARELGYILTEE